MNKVPLIVTNDDRGTISNGKMFPGAGSQLQAIIAGTNLRKGSSHSSTSLEEPGTFDLVGKPNPFAMNLIKEQHGLDPNSRTIMIGDRPNTDIVFGKVAGVDTCLVLTGVVLSKEDFEDNWQNENQDYEPTYIMHMVGDRNATL